MTRLSFVALLCAGAVSCSPPARLCSSSAECASGQSCVGGQCRAGSSTGGGLAGSGGGNGTGGNGTAGGSGNTGGGTAGGGPRVVTGCDPMAVDNGSRDTDCDGLTDLEEYGTDYGNNARTDPCNSDSDADGLPDGLEMGKTTTPNASCGATFIPDADPASKTNPTQKDTDGDGLDDGVEDRDQDGRRQATETNPLRVDTDCDGYSDKQEVVDMAAGCATNPTLKDTDGDGLSDGVEGRLVPPGADPRGCAYGPTTFDADPTTGTNACAADTDGDGVADGAEDTNSNGRVDMGELNPNDSMDAMGPAQQACSTANLRPVSFHSSGNADVQVALVPEFTEIARLTLANDERGVVFYNPTTKVGGIAFSKTMGVAASPSAEETQARGAIAGIGTVSTPLTQTYTTWDGFPGVRGTYDVGSNRDVKDFVNELARRFLGAGAGGLLMGSGGTTGPFKVQAVYVRRTATRAVLVIAAIPLSLYSGAPLFQLDDAGGGTAVAQSPDLTATQCEAFNASANAKVDFLWVVDDSCSMATSQDAVRNAGTLFGNKLNSAGLDWRAAAVTTAYYASSQPGSTREWTSSVATMSSWFDQSSGAAWFGTSGNGIERGFPSARAFINRTGSQVRGPFRSDANVNLVFLSDTGDQSGEAPSAFHQYLTTTFAGRQVLAHAIACPAGQDCGDGSRESTPPTYGTVVQLSGGVLGSIEEFNVTNPNATQRARQEAVIDAILSAAIGGTGRQLNRPPISATIKVAIATGGTAGACNTADVPRSRQNGWDIDSATRRIVFYGTCRPTMGTRVAVSYRYWIDNSPDANGDPCGATCVAPFVCDPNSRSCVCAPNCGNTCGTGLTCRQATCACEPGIE